MRFASFTATGDTRHVKTYFAGLCASSLIQLGLEKLFRVNINPESPTLANMLLLYVITLCMSGLIQQSVDYNRLQSTVK